jgi:hypothetical protein
MIDFKEIPHTDDTWELFARDFLLELGFDIESPPDRGPDGGKDMLVTEFLRGTLGNYKFRWLVSCKHFATSGSAVSEADERNILERVSSFQADGFIGFYSTVPSSGLNSRLLALRTSEKIKDYRIFDHQLIENHLVTVGYSHLMLRYLPKSYEKIKPLHLMSDKYEPLECKSCGKDLLLDMFKAGHKANLVRVESVGEDSSKNYVEDIYCVCKGECDNILQRRYREIGFMTSWTDLADLIIPIEYLRYLMATMNRLRAGIDIYKDAAFEKEKLILITLAQKVLRYVTEKEWNRVKILSTIPSA